MGIRIPKVPQDVPEAKARNTAIRKMMAGRKFIRLPAELSTRAATYLAAPRLSVIAFKAQAKDRISMAGTICLKPSGRQSMQSAKGRD